MTHQAETAVRPAPGRPSSARAWSRALELTAPIVRRPDRILPDGHRGARRDVRRRAGPLSDGECLTYRALAERSTRYARWAIEQGLAKGDAVCLLMPNRPEYMAIWLGITRVGGVVALLNTNLAGPSLAHCINIAAPRHLIVAAELVDRVTAVRQDLAGAPTIWVHGAGHDQFPRIDDDIERYRRRHAGTEAERRPVTIDDRALYIYTSGTTGLPKAANVSHARVMQWSHWFAGLMDVRSSDRMLQLPADVSQRRRRARDRRGSGRRRLGGDPRTILCAPVLERRRPLGLHAVPVHRRAVPVPAAYRAAPA